MSILLVAIPIAIILALQIKATLLVLRDSLCNRTQRISQLALIWLLPMIGAIIVLAVHRPHEKASGKYQESDAIEDYRFTSQNSWSDSYHFDDTTDNN